MKNPFKKQNENKENLEKEFSFKAFGLQLLATVIVLSALIYIFSVVDKRINPVKDISISELAKEVTLTKISSIEVDGNSVTAVSTDGQKYKSVKDTSNSIEETLLNYGVTAENLKSISVKNIGAGYLEIFLGIIPFLLPAIIIVILFYILTRQMKSGGMQALTFGQSKARMIDPNDENQKITFKDVAGAKEAKVELLEIVDFLKNPQKFIEIGAVIPKGVVLMGAPGTGKTMLARAVAGEAGVPFFHLSGSEFIEMFVGVGASRVRDLFAQAKRVSPAIIFIDEIDAIGRVRGTGLGGGNDEREQTLNQILVEMDGFEPTEKVIVMAATNRPDVLDPALVRPGRFDRRITLDLPDRSDRLEILEVQSRKKPKDETVNLKVVAERTPGFSGADIYSLMNESAIFAARENRNKISQNDIINSIEKVILGPERRSHLMSAKEKILTAYHEAGHALVGAVLPNADAIHKISIISRGHAGGFTMSLPDDEKKLHTKNVFLDEIAMTLGGYAVEEIINGEVTTGPSSDLQTATAKAKDMIVKYGMSEKVGPRALVMSLNKRKYGESEDDHSPELMSLVDREIERIVREQLERAKEVVNKNRNVLEQIKDELIKNETIERDDFEKILSSNNIPLKKSEN